MHGRDYTRPEPIVDTCYNCKHGNVCKYMAMGRDVEERKNLAYICRFYKLEEQ